MLRRSLLLGLAALPLVAACAAGKSSGSKSPDSKSSGGAKDIPGMLTELRRFKELLKAAQSAGLTQTLGGGGPYTLFAPTDSAFDAMEDRDLQKLMQDKGRLARVLEYHLVAGRFTDRDFIKVKSLKTLAGPSLTVTKMGQAIKINEANIDQANIGASNGMIHAIDLVLMPPR